MKVFITASVGNGTIWEGQFKDNNLNGFGRYISSTGISKYYNTHNLDVEEYLFDQRWYDLVVNLIVIWI